MSNLTPAQLKSLHYMVRECRNLLRTLPKDDPRRATVGRLLRFAEREIQARNKDKERNQ